MMSDRGYHIYIGKYIDGEFVQRDLELDFPGLIYKSVTGITSYGSSVLYEESYAEEEEVDVYIPSVMKRKQTDIVLTLCFVGSYADSSAVTDAKRYEAADVVYNNFVDYVSGSELVYWDTVRNRKVKMYLSDAVSVKTDKLYGEPYKEVSFKFKNKFGRSFSMDDKIFPPVM